MKKIKIEPLVTLKSSSESEFQLVKIRTKDGKASTPTMKSLQKNPIKLIGKVWIRLEKKGRNGKPVIIIYHFSDPNAQDEVHLKYLCAQLKEKLACGGTIENGEIILMHRDLEKIKKCLQESFEITTEIKL